MTDGLIFCLMIGRGLVWYSYFAFLKVLVVCLGLRVLWVCSLVWVWLCLGWVGLVVVIFVGLLWEFALFYLGFLFCGVGLSFGCLSLGGFLGFYSGLFMCSCLLLCLVLGLWV